MTFSESALTRCVDLYQLIQENCPDAVKTGEIKNQFGRKVAIVSQMSYMILIVANNRIGCVRLAATRFNSEMY
jgi:hypothetical protein